MSNDLMVIPDHNEMQTILSIADMAVKSRLIPSSIQTKEQAAIIILKGRELGLPPMVAFSHISVIQGKPTMSAEIMLAYIYKTYPNAEIEIEQKDDNACVIKAKRPNAKKLEEFRWDVARAKKMGLMEKDNYKKQPGTMFFWRAITEMKRSIFPEVLMGIDYTKEELEDSGFRDAAPIPPAEVAAEIMQPKTIKNYAPQTAEEAQERLKNPVPMSEPPPPPPAEPAGPTRGELGKQIASFGWDGAKLTKFIQDEFKKTAGQLTNSEMAQLIEKMKGAK